MTAIRQRHDSHGALSAIDRSLEWWNGDEQSWKKRHKHESFAEKLSAGHTQIEAAWDCQPLLGTTMEEGRHQIQDPCDCFLNSYHVAYTHDLSYLTIPSVFVASKIQICPLYLAQP